MKLVPQEVKLQFWRHSETTVLKKLEEIGRYAYASHDRIKEGSEIKFVNMILKKQHLGILEHQNVTFSIKTNRAIANEFTRHRLFSFVQSSSRYIKYDTDNTEIIHPLLENGDLIQWMKSIQDSIFTYRTLLQRGISAEKARGILPLDLSTDFIVTGNLRSWIDFLKLRTDIAAHPQMREIAILIENILKDILPTIFE